MSEQNATAPTTGGFSGDLAEAFAPAAGSGCCGSPAANTGTGIQAGAAAPCFGTAAEAKAETAGCGTAAKTEAGGCGAGCCG